MDMALRVLPRRRRRRERPEIPFSADRYSSAAGGFQVFVGIRASKLRNVKTFGWVAKESKVAKRKFRSSVEIL